MKQDEFISGIKQAVYEAAVKGTMGIIQNPPGRRPAAKLLALSQWFEKLSVADRKLMESVVELSCRQAVFGLLAVIDGVRQIEHTSEKGTLELWFCKDDAETLLNSPEAEQLHDLFNQQVPPV